MPDVPMSPVEIDKGLGQLFATQYADADTAEVEQEQVAESEEGTDTTDELGATPVEDSEVVDDAEAEGDEEAAATDDPEFALDLKVNGVEHRITDRAEAIKLAQLGMHFTQRNEAVIQRERQADQIVEEASKARDQYAAYLPEIESYLANPFGEKPMRDKFDTQAAYDAAFRQWAEGNERVQALKAERQRVAEEQSRERDRALERWVREQDQAVLTEIPEWHDNAVMRAETQAMTEYALRKGISQQALQNPLIVRDKAFVTILRDAMRFEQMQAKGATEVKKVQAKVAAPGPAKPPGETVNRRRRELEKMAHGTDAKAARAQEALLGQLITRHSELRQPGPRKR